MSLKQVAVVMIITAILGAAGLTAGINLIDSATTSNKLGDFDTISMEVTPVSPKTDWFTVTTGAKSQVYTLAPIGWTDPNPFNDANKLFTIAGTPPGTLTLSDGGASTFTVNGHIELGSLDTDGVATAAITADSYRQAGATMYTVGEDETAKALLLDLFNLRGTAFELYVETGSNPAGEAMTGVTDNYTLIDAIVKDSIAFLPVNEAVLLESNLSESLVSGIVEEYAVVYLEEIYSEAILRDNYALAVFGAADYATATAGQQPLIQILVDSVREMYTAQVFFLPRKDSALLSESDKFQFQ